MSWAIELQNYSFSYAGEAKQVLRNVTCRLQTGSFTVLAGLTGSGKSTLLRALKPEVAVAGTASGSIRVMGDDPATIDARESARRVGFVMQDPENQLVTDIVWHELAFGLENIGTEQREMRRRVAETAHFFGIGGWFDRKVADLSGGQKQLLNLAAVVVMQPSVLVLDEPTSQLDPIAAKSFFDVLGRVNEELGITVVIIEHRLEEVLPMADHVLFLREGALAFDGEPQDFIAWLSRSNASFVSALPAATRIAHVVDSGRSGTWPLTVRQGRAFLAQHVDACERALESSTWQPREPRTAGSVLMRTTDLWFRYSKEDPFVLRGVDFDVRAGQLAAIVGGNGSGKSTLLSALAGIRRPERGKVRKAQGTKIALMAQDPKTLFVCDTLLDDLMEWSEYGGYGVDEVRDIMERMGLSGYEKRHPYDLSGGEVQKAALAKLVLLDPDVLLLDEPVKGIDVTAKAYVARMLGELADAGKAIVFTAHDLDFVAQTADECSMMFGCDITCTQDCRGFFNDNLFYSTAASRIMRGYLPGCTTVDDAEGLFACAQGVVRADVDDVDDPRPVLGKHGVRPAAGDKEPEGVAGGGSDDGARIPQSREVWAK